MFRRADFVVENFNQMQSSTISFEIESTMSGVMIGHRGINKMNIQRISGAKMRVYKRDSYGRRKVKITGTQNQQQMAVSLIESLIGKKTQIQSEPEETVPKCILKRGSGPLSSVALGPGPVQLQQPSSSTQVDMVCNPSEQMSHQRRQPPRMTYPHRIKQQFPTQTSSVPVNEKTRTTLNKTIMFPSRKPRLPTIYENLLEALFE